MINKLKSLKSKKTLDSDQQGFTIIELMIATAVLSTLILVATIIIINIGNLYDKGVNLAHTQDAVRDITDEMAQDIKFSGYSVVSDPNTTATPIDGPSSITPRSAVLHAYCVGSVRYSYVIGYELGSNTQIDGVTNPYPTVPAVLWRDTNPNGPNGACSAVDLFSPAALTADGSGVELAPSGTRLTDFAVTGGETTPYNISVMLVYGDYDLLSNYTPGNQSTTVECSGNNGDQFCATASLTTNVARRLSQ
jgi:prepilin-type N-terminal cleavage/methylation domain-containing protein